MRIAHFDGFAGVPWTLAEAQRRLGHDVVVFSLHDTPYRFPYDEKIEGTEGAVGWNVAMLRRWKTLAEFDVLHVHGGIWRSQLVYRLFKQRYPWKVLAVHFHGSETRSRKGLHHIGVADLQFHSTPDLAAYLPKSTWVPNPIDLPPPPPAPDNPVPRFGHFVSDPGNKGTLQVIEQFRKVFGLVETTTEGSVQKLRGKEAELLVVTRVPHDNALLLMKECDAIIDQFAPFGIYGMVAIEAMAMGKPVLGTPRLEWYPGCPVIPLQLPGAERRLLDLARDSGLRTELGRAGRAYVAGVHEATRIARQVLKAYYMAGQQAPHDTRRATSYWKKRGAGYAKESEWPRAKVAQARQAEELLGVLGGIRFESVGEVGCGFGRIGRQVAERFQCTWVGVDLSRNQLLEARRRGAPLDGFLLEGSASALPLADDSVDLALSIETLMHIPPEQIEATLGELLRIARRQVVHLDWYEDYMVGFQTGWCWAHDYARLWESAGAVVRVVPLRSNRLQTVFIATRRRDLDLGALDSARTN